MIYLVVCFYILLFLLSLIVSLVAAQRMKTSTGWAIFFGLLFSPVSGVAYGYMLLSGDRKPWRIAIIGICIWIGMIIVFAFLTLAALGTFNQSSQQTPLSSSNNLNFFATTTPVSSAQSSAIDIPIQPSQQDTNTTIPQPKKNLSSIIKEWESNVAYITCYWDNNPNIDDQGSGFLTQFTNGSVAVMTNKHVVANTTYGGANYCEIKVPNNPTTMRVVNENIIASGPQGYDWAYLKLGLEVYINNNTNGKSMSDTAAAKSISQCTGTREIGANVLILGYPDYGSTGSITATQGIISGFDGSYYTTSAEISAGNSGGLAIDTDGDCYLGIPSAVVSGEYGNLGRILSTKAIFK